jgi:prophage regulatory protein
MTARRTRFPRLAGLAEVAGLAGVSRQRAGQLAAHPDFPAPVQRLAMGPVWLEDDVLRFLATPRKAGRKPLRSPGSKGTATVSP